jgi:hypothetical protein
MNTQKLLANVSDAWPAKPNADLEAELRRKPVSLLNWVLARVLNAEEVPSVAGTWIEEALQDATKSRKGDLVFWRLLRWTSLSAAQELLGVSGEEAAHQAVDWIAPASKKVTVAHERSELVACTIGLLSYLEEDDASLPWRQKQLNQEWSEGGEASLFQSLYLASPAALEDELDNLACETAYACADVLNGSPGRHTDGLVLSLARHARSEGLDVGEALRAGAGRLRDAAGVSVKGPTFSLPKAVVPTLSMDLVVEGEGEVLPLSSSFPQLSAGFTRHFRDFIKAVAEGEVPNLAKKEVLATVKDEQANVRATVKYDPSKVEITTACQEALTRRFELAVSRTRVWESKFRAQVELVFEPMG